MRRRLAAVAWAACFAALLWALELLRPMYRIVGE
jgi:hypothetical protein